MMSDTTSSTTTNNATAIESAMMMISSNNNSDTNSSAGGGGGILDPTTLILGIGFVMVVLGFGICVTFKAYHNRKEEQEQEQEARDEDEAAAAATRQLQQQEEGRAFPSTNRSKTAGADLEQQRALRSAYLETILPSISKNGDEDETETETVTEERVEDDNEEDEESEKASPPRLWWFQHLKERLQEEEYNDPEIGANNSDKWECSICLSSSKVENEDSGDIVIQSTAGFCDHRFHRSCIGEWLTSKAECPCCRQCFLKEDYIMMKINESALQQKQDGKDCDESTFITPKGYVPPLQTTAAAPPLLDLLNNNR